MKDRETWLKELKVSDTIWCAVYHRHGKADLPCPVCFGKLKVTLILGDESRVVTPCNYCAHGFNPPTGITSEYQMIADQEQRVITSIDINQTSEGEKREYHTGLHYWEPDKIFQTEAEAKERASALAKEDMVADATNAARIKKDNWKSYSWNAGYHMREARRDRKSAERHEQLAQICRGRSKDLKGDRGDE